MESVNESERTFLVITKLVPKHMVNSGLHMNLHEEYIPIAIVDRMAKIRPMYLYTAERPVRTPWS